MPDITVHNETEYALSATILDQIKRDALEYFGESIRAIRVQYGIERHAFNAKTGEMRYAFSPGDYGLVDTSVAFHEPYHSRGVPHIDDDTDEDVDDVNYEDVEVEADDAAAPALESLDEELDDSEDEDTPEFEGLHDEFDDFDEEDDKELLYDDDDDYD